MVKKQVNMHMGRKRALIYIASFSLASFLTFVFLFWPSRLLLGQLDSECRSKYLYSGVADELAEDDSYYQFDADIGFYLNMESQICLNADIVMQSDGMQYTDLVYWNSVLLKKNEIAISRNLASSNGIKRGDVLYSKHIVTGDILEYYVAELLPDTSGIRPSKNKEFNDGVIIMGFDEEYTDNLSHKVLLYSVDSIENVFARTQGSLTGILYREDEIKYFCKKMIPYASAIFVLLFCCAIFFEYRIKKCISGNYRRAMIAGYGKNELNFAFYRCSLGVGFVSVLVMFSISMVFLLIVGTNIAEVTLLIVSVVVESIGVSVSSSYNRKCLWRR